MNSVYRKRILAYICTAAVAMSLCACGSNPAPELEATLPEENTADSGEAAAPVVDQYDENGNLIVVIPEDAVPGDILNDGSVFLHEAAPETFEEAEALLNTYKDISPAGPDSLFFTTPEYSGFIEYDGTYFLCRRSSGFEEVIFFRPEGITSTIQRELDEDGNPVREYQFETGYENRVEIIYEGTRNTQIQTNIETGEHYLTSVTDEINGIRIPVMREFRGYRHEYAYADASARILSSYAVTEPDGTHYVYTMDGCGNDISNIVSMELTVGGATNVYYPGNLPLGTGYIAPPMPHELGAG